MPTLDLVAPASLGSNIKASPFPKHPPLSRPQVLVKQSLGTFDRLGCVRAVFRCSFLKLRVSHSLGFFFSLSLLMKLIGVA